MVSAQTDRWKPISKQVIRGAMMLTDTIETIAINSANSGFDRGSFL